LKRKGHYGKKGEETVFMVFGYKNANVSVRKKKANYPDQAKEDSTSSGTGDETTSSG